MVFEVEVVFDVEVACIICCIAAPIGLVLLVMLITLPIRDLLSF